MWSDPPFRYWTCQGICGLIDARAARLFLAMEFAISGIYSRRWRMTAASDVAPAAKKEARRIAAGFDVLNLALGRAGSDYIWW